MKQRFTIYQYGEDIDKCIDENKQNLVEYMYTVEIEIRELILPPELVIPLLEK
jgi:hypothetical protein